MIYLIFQTILLPRTEYGEDQFLSLLSEGMNAGKKENSGSLKVYGSLFQKNSFASLSWSKAIM